jgi:hypothetical protein
MRSASARLQARARPPRPTNLQAELPRTLMPCWRLDGGTVSQVTVYEARHGGATRRARPRYAGSFETAPARKLPPMTSRPVRETAVRAGDGLRGAPLGNRTCARASSAPTTPPATSICLPGGTLARRRCIKVYRKYMRSASSASGDAGCRPEPPRRQPGPLCSPPALRHPERPWPAPIP